MGREPDGRGSSRRASTECPGAGPVRADHDRADHDRADPAGKRILRASFWGTAVFTAVAVSAAIAPDGLERVALVVDVALFVAGCILFCYAFIRAVDRSRTDAIGIGGLFFLAGDVAPAPVRRRLVGAFAVQCVVGLATAGSRIYTILAAGTLVPVYGLALCGVWAARYGGFPSRPPQPSRRPRRRSGSDGQDAA